MRKTKPCGRCKQPYPISHFGVVADTRTKALYRQSYCKLCKQKYNRAYYRKHKPGGKR